MIITIDGPTASGKSTVAKLLAERLGFVHLNSGLLYRALAYVLVHNFNYSLADLADPDQGDLDQIVQSGDLVYQYTDGQAQALYQGLDITPKLKTEEMDNYASVSSANPKVRATLAKIQSSMALKSDLVAEGRDTGTKIFPQAELKIFLTASLPVRVQRWQKFMQERGHEYSLAESERLVSERDRRDTERLIAPLKPAPGAIIIDGSTLNLDQVVEKIINLVNL